MKTRERQLQQLMQAEINATKIGDRSLLAIIRKVKAAISSQLEPSLG